MENFAFMIHPVDPRRDVRRKFKLLGYLPTGVINYFCRFFPPVYISHITGIRSILGSEAEGWFVAAPFTPATMLALDYERYVAPKLIAVGRMAEKLGARLLGLGAFTSVVGDAGVSIARALSIPVTTGNSYTIAIAVRGAVEAAALMEIDIRRAKVAIIGATGAIGSVASQLLARQAASVVLVGRRLDALRTVAEKVRRAGPADVAIFTDISQGIHDADVVVAVTSAVGSVIEAQALKRGAVVCDVARPRDVSQEVIKQRDDVLVIEGGMVEVPGDVDFHFDFGYPPRMAYACMAETMTLALSRRYESFTLGREVTLEQVEEIDRLATAHGFKLGGFRSFERAVTPEMIAAIRERVRRPG